MSIRTNIFSLTKLFEDGHVMEISLEFERRAKAYNELLADNERLRKAGDRLASATIIFETMSEEERAKRRAEWKAAKEGGDAK